MANNPYHTWSDGTEQSRRMSFIPPVMTTVLLTWYDAGQVKRIDILPDDVLLEIFDFYMIIPSYTGNPRYKAWQSLVHVCRRWRILVFGSPRRLDLRLFLYIQNTRTRHLASLTSRRFRRYAPKIRHGQHHLCGTRAEQSRI